MMKHEASCIAYFIRCFRRHHDHMILGDVLLRKSMCIPFQWKTLESFDFLKQVSFVMAQKDKMLAYKICVTFLQFHSGRSGSDSKAAKDILY